MRLDAVPQEFGDAEPVDQTDLAALRGEWLRQLKMSASYNSEALVGLLALVAAV